MVDPPLTIPPYMTDTHKIPCNYLIFNRLRVNIHFQPKPTLKSITKVAKRARQVKAGAESVCDVRIDFARARKLAAAAK